MKNGLVQHLQAPICVKIPIDSIHKDFSYKRKRKTSKNQKEEQQNHDYINMVKIILFKVKEICQS